MNNYEKLSTARLLRGAAAIVDESKFCNLTWHQLADAMFKRANELEEKRHTCPGSGKPPYKFTREPDHPRYPGRGQCSHCATDFKLRYDGNVRIHR